MISGLYLFIREIIALIRFYFVNKNERDIVYYSDDTNSYSYFEGVIDYLTNNADKDTYYITSEANDPLFKSNNNRLHVFYVKKLLALFIGLCDSQVIVMTMPDLSTIPARCMTSASLSTQACWYGRVILQ